MGMESGIGYSNDKLENKCVSNINLEIDFQVILFFCQRYMKDNSLMSVSI